MIQATLIQHPVGQGGLMSGLLETPNRRFRWIYDCGSNQGDALRREINIVVKTQRQIDYLFLSHLDSDHINGIEMLLGEAHVAEVVLPYLNSVDKLIAIGHDISEGRLTGNFITFLNDTEAWFSARGVERITYIEPDSSEKNNEPVYPKEGKGGKEEFEWMQSQILHKSSVMQHLDISAILQFSASSAKFDWIFAPYAYRPSERKLQLFIDELKAKFQVLEVNKINLDDILKFEEAKSNLRKCYDHIWSDHNLVSMALYSGPIKELKWLSFHNYHHFHTSLSKIAWLSTGDMHLDRNIRRKRFVEHYNQLLDNVKTFILPHHGSRHNFTPLILDNLPNATQCIAASGMNSYGHPAFSVIKSVTNSGKDFIRVSENEFTELLWRHSLEISR